MSIPTTQKAVIFETNGGKLEYKDIPVPKPKPNELLPWVTMLKVGKLVILLVLNG